MPDLRGTGRTPNLSLERVGTEGIGGVETSHSFCPSETLRVQEVLRHVLFIHCDPTVHGPVVLSSEDRDSGLRPRLPTSSPPTLRFW